MKKIKAAFIAILGRVYKKNYIAILGEKIYENKTPLVYRIAKRNPEWLREQIKLKMKRDGISNKDAIQQLEFFGERIGGKDTL